MDVNDKYGRDGIKAGSVHVIQDFYSRALNRQQTIRVYLPPNYDDKACRYPVVYLHDGQWCFHDGSSETWEADVIAEQLILSGQIPPVILVGIDCNEKDRRREMSHITPPPFRRMGRRGYIPCYSFEGEGMGYSYEYCVTDEVKPYVDANFRTLPDKKNTLLAGASMGGLVTLNMGTSRHETYGMLGLLSPAIHWVADEFYNSITWRDQKIWLDCGMVESYYVDNARELYKIYSSLGYKQGKDLWFLAQPGAIHTERYFRERFKMLLLWMFGKTPKAKSCVILGNDTVSVGGMPMVCNVIVIYENGVMGSDMDADFDIREPGIVEINGNGEIRALCQGETEIIYHNETLTANKHIKAVNSLSRDILLEIYADIPEDTPEQEPIVFHFFRDQYCILQKKEDNLYHGLIGIPRDWEFFGHFTRCVENRDMKTECTHDGQPVNRYIKADDNIVMHYKVEKWSDL